MEKAREFQKNIYFCFTNYAKAFNCVDHNKLENHNKLEEIRMLDHLTCFLRNLQAGQEATVRTGQGTTDCIKIGTRVCQGCILSPCLPNFYAEYIIRNAGLNEAQAGIKNARRTINNLRYADDTTLMAERKEELKILLTKVKDESEKSWLKTQHSKKEDHGIWSQHLMANTWGSIETVTDFILLGSRITGDGDCSHEIKRHLLLGRKAMTNLDSILKVETLL